SVVQASEPLLRQAPTPWTRLDDAVVWAAIVVVTALAWAYLVSLAGASADARALAAMGMSVDEQWTATGALCTFAMWTAMMAGMMAGAAAPMILAYARLCPSRRSARRTVAIFAGGYLAGWAGFSLVATVAQWALRQAALLSPTMAASTPRVAGGILIGAGLYQ